MVSTCWTFPLCLTSPHKCDCRKSLWQSQLVLPFFAALWKVIHPKNKKLSKLNRLISLYQFTHLQIYSQQSSESDFWTQICKHTIVITKNKFTTLSVQIFHRTHITHHRVNKMGFSDSDICTQCSQNTTDTYFLHYGSARLFGIFVVKLLKHIPPCLAAESHYLLICVYWENLSHPTKKAKHILTTLAIGEKIIPIN